MDWTKLKIFCSQTKPQNDGLDMDLVKSAFNKQTYGLNLE